mmetsp:Transcript_10665/g.22624  ORF Transcript_10665/g.22624 Transcript_10665/m.22624 type:complete len:407 (-) Transcript_10665:131-1351(-)
MVCTTPFPNVCSPISVARWLSFNAPDRISLALAVAWFTSTATGASHSGPSSRVSYSSCTPFLSATYTIATPLGKNCRATSTPPGKYPPGLFRRSMTYLLAPAACNDLSAFVASSAVLELNCRMSSTPRSTPSLGLFTSSSRTEVIRRFSRTKSTRRSPLLLLTLIETRVPGEPRILAAASSGERVSSDSPSMSVMMSPLRTPDRAAGPPSIGFRILSSPSTRAGYNCTPTPANSPVAADVSDSSCAGDRNLVYGSSSSLSMPRIVSYASSMVLIGFLTFFMRILNQSTPLNDWSTKDWFTTRHASATNFCGSDNACAHFGAPVARTTPSATAATPRRSNTENLSISLTSLDTADNADDGPDPSSCSFSARAAALTLHLRRCSCACETRRDEFHASQRASAISCTNH